MSKYCLQHSPVPVIVVRPSSKRDKKKRKRLQDPTRRGYRDILDKSDNTASADPGYTLDPLHRLSIMPGDSMGTLAELERRDAEEEARMVAEAIGYRPDQIAPDGEPLSRVTSARSDVSRRSGRSGRSGSFGSHRSDSPETLRSPSRALLSPQLRAVADSGAETSEFESDDEDNSAAAPHSAYYEAQERALMEARERALKAEEEEKERERQTKEKKENARSGGGGGVLDLLDQLGGGGGDDRGGSTKGKKSRYPIP